MGDVGVMLHCLLYHLVGLAISDQLPGTAGYVMERGEKEGECAQALTVRAPPPPTIHCRTLYVQGDQL